MSIIGVMEQKIQSLEDELKEMEVSIMKLSYASRLELPISKNIWKVKMISKLTKPEINLFKPISEKYWNKEIEIEKLKHKVGDEYMKNYEKTKDIQYKDNAIKYYQSAIGNIDSIDLLDPDDIGIIIMEDDQTLEPPEYKNNQYDFNYYFYNLDPEIKRLVNKKYFEIPKLERQSFEEFYKHWRDTPEAEKFVKEINDRNSIKYQSAVEMVRLADNRRQGWR